MFYITNAEYDKKTPFYSEKKQLQVLKTKYNYLPLIIYVKKNKIYLVLNTTAERNRNQVTSSSTNIVVFQRVYTDDNVRGFLDFSRYHCTRMIILYCMLESA